ncbi:MAG: flavodoxin [Candidatus Hodarchaeales archaeon]|jgi:flavodoxin I
MKKIGLFYSTETGNTEYVAKLIYQELASGDNMIITIEDIGQTTVYQIQAADFLIFGVPTWFYGDLDREWEKFFPNLDGIDFTDKKIALFGLGDQELYTETFLEAMAIIYNKFKENGADIVGEWPTEGYNSEESSATMGEKFVGLAIDEDNQPDLTKDRVKRWVEQLKREYL